MRLHRKKRRIEMSQATMPGGIGYTGSTGSLGAHSASEIRDDLGKAGTHLKNAASSAACVAKEQLSRAVDKVADQERSFEKWLQDCVEERPLTVLFSAIGIGVLAGFWLRSR